MTTKNPDQTIHIIGAGLAGSEAAWQCAHAGVPVILHEMRGIKGTAAHKTDGCAELVCSNSFRSDDALNNAVGLLHAEMRNMNSLIMREGDKAAVPAGGALAVDRDIFSQGVTKALSDHPLIAIERGEISGLPPEEWNNVIIATGPLTSDPLAQAIQTLTGEKELAFFDALAPIVHLESIDMSKTWFQSRYDKGSGKDYINCPMTEEQYHAFIDALLSAEYGLFKDWELPSGAQTLAEQEIDTPYFDGCMPIEIMAARGRETLRFGPMKPVGLTNPHAPDVKPYAIVQLRQDNALGTLYNIVGFQTKMKYGDQTRVFRMIPGLENAEFARLGGLHRNTFINSPKLLDQHLRLKDEYIARHYPPLPALASLNPPLSPTNGGEGLRERGRRSIRFAGQITGCEGYVESASIGLIAGRMAAAEILGLPIPLPPPTTAMGALLNHITGGAQAETFQPMNINFGLFPPLSKEETTEEYINKHGKTKLRKLKSPERKQAYCKRALRDQEAWLSNTLIKNAAAA